MGRLFGTDGVRGRANADLTPELALAVAVAAAHTLAESDRSHPPLAVVGRDPRASGEMLEAAVVAGLTSAGANVVRVGVLPTPGGGVPGRRGQGRPRRDALRLAQPDAGQRDQALRRRRAQAARRDRGRRSRRRSSDGTAGWTARPAPASAGCTTCSTAPSTTSSTWSAASPHRLDGLKVVVDCANGAATDVGAGGVPGGRRRGDRDPRRAGRPQHQRRLRLDPPGHAAGRGGRARGATSGIAHDGDADRCLAVTADGDEVDGDQIMAILALAMRDAGTLTDDTLVATVMSNLGLRIAMREAGIRLIETKVGDRYVLEELRASGLALGGEQSGHIVHAGVRDHRRRRAHRPAPDGPDGRDRQVAGRPGRGGAPSCRRC